MEPSEALEHTGRALLKTLFRMCRDTRSDQQPVSDVARQLQLDYAVTKQVITWLERQGYVETLTFGQKVAFTPAGLVLTQRLLH